MSTAGELIVRCFHARTLAHVYHLKTRSYAAHKALQEFYDGIIPLADTFAEAYQGCCGLIEDWPMATPRQMYDSPEKMLSGLYEWIDDNRDNFSESHLQNIIDELQTLIDSTQYKLKFLK